MKTSDAVIGGMIIGMALGVILCMMTVTALAKNSYIYSDGYRQGQIDSLTGNINYYLKENKDKTKTWEIIDENK